MVSKTLHQHEPECIHVYVAADIYSYIYRTVLLLSGNKEIKWKFLLP